MSVRVIQYKRGSREGYTAYVHIPIPGQDPYRRSQTLPTRAKAKAWGEAEERRVYDDMKAGRLGRKSQAVPTLGEFFPEFVEKHARAQNLKPSYIATLEDICRCHLLPTFGNRKLDSIDDQSIQEFKLAKNNVSKKTLNNILSALRKSLEMAVEWKHLDALPCRIRQVKAGRPEMTFYDFEPYERLVGAARKCGPMPYLIALLGGEAGLRCGEMVALRWANVDLSRRQLHVCESAWDGIVGPTKGWHSRYVPLTDRLAKALVEQQRRSKGERVLHNDGGMPLTENSTRSRLRAAAKAAGVKHGLHVLRHTFVSLLLMKDSPLVVVQRLVGHKNPATTMRYTHVTAGALHDAIKRLNPPPAA